MPARRDAALTYLLVSRCEAQIAPTREDATLCGIVVLRRCLVLAAKRHRDPRTSTLLTRAPPESGRRGRRLAVGVAALVHRKGAANLSPVCASCAAVGMKGHLVLLDKAEKPLFCKLDGKRKKLIGLKSEGSLLPSLSVDIVSGVRGLVVCTLSLVVACLALPSESEAEKIERWQRSRRREPQRPLWRRVRLFLGFLLR